MRPRYIFFLFVWVMFSCTDIDKTEEDLSKTHFQRGKTALEAEDIPGAIENLELADNFSEEGNFQEDIRYNLAYAYYYSASYEQALSVLNDLPGELDVLWLKGLCLRYNEQYDEAIQAFNEAITLLPADSKQVLDLKNWIANCYIDKGNIQEAIDVLESIAQTDNNSHIITEVKTNLGFALIQVASYQESIQILEEALATEEMTMAKINLAEAYYRHGDAPRAATLVEEVLAHPDLTIREQDLAQLLKAEMAGADITYLRDRLSQHDKSAEVTRVHAQKGYQAAEARLQNLEERRAANNRQLAFIILGGIALLAAMQFAFYTIRYRNKVRYMRERIGYLLDLDSDHTQT
ncbi:tetratricopeptide repeat protein [Roseivirga sp. BDSF3-8]|uniref:tetratricopeptide repeat protein n=1 Tax=Roseivirga sp. BDSF3-8 TaxID=3241598 RepID=UPI003531B7B6